MSTTKPTPVDQMSFESAMTELEQIVREMESGKTGLEDSIAAYERGMALKNHCAKRLQEAEMRIAQISVATDGTISATPVSSPED